MPGSPHRAQLPKYTREANPLQPVAEMDGFIGLRNGRDWPALTPRRGYSSGAAYCEFEEF